MGCASIATMVVGVRLAPDEVAKREVTRLPCRCGADVPDNYCSKCGLPAICEEEWTPLDRWLGEVIFEYEGERLTTQIEGVKPFGPHKLSMEVVSYTGQHPRGIDDYSIAVGISMTVNDYKTPFASMVPQDIEELKLALGRYGITEEPRLMVWTILSC